MYHAIIQQFVRSLQNLDLIMGKAVAHAEARKFDPNNYLTARLAPDMLPFSVQVRIACDGAKAAAANLSGKDAPKHEDTEVTFDDLRLRIRKCVAWLQSLEPADFAATTPEKPLHLPYPAGKGMKAGDYILSRQIPNVYFHIVTAYALLRSAGVEIGKADYLGPIALFDV